MMSDEETSAENEEDLWAAAADDLAQQREMLRDAADDAEAETEEAPAQEDSVATAVAPAMETAPAVEQLSDAAKNDLGRILDIPLKISVELGKTKMLINDLLQLGQGSVIELTKLVGEPLEVMVNNQLVARGEVVVVNEKFGIRLTEISPPKERIEKMV